ncbi:DoxX family protein [Paraurantiacibacter namhicola]|uniref:DoxX n=1 Tax=Paraurantiacibacter namhicola TaxID=645517 RepID=A0A1C7D732_9SPHN|nr:DoxX family protein [Paraurantiacibacter namhicola]ANU07279.1 hypothetical protein A6F65_00969 [Paraurantiacibacter namhicola]
MLLAVFYAIAGYLHIAAPENFLRITPEWVPYAPLVVTLTGWAEIAGAIALLQPFSLRLRQAGGIGLAVYALCVWPANINHMLMDMAAMAAGEAPSVAAGMAYHVPRMFAQPMVIWLALWSANAVDWPFRRRASGQD